jgi:hypothetical protein
MTFKLFSDISDNFDERDDTELCVCNGIAQHY